LIVDLVGPMECKEIPIAPTFSVPLAIAPLGISPACGDL
jgi:hypothetical protein